MVRHHTKKRKINIVTNLEKKLENLDHFAGSSEEESAGGGDGADGANASHDEYSRNTLEMEESEDDYDDVYEGKITKEESNSKCRPTHLPKHPKRREVHCRVEGSENDYKDYGEPDQKSLGMANAMARILGGQKFEMILPQPPSAVNDTDARAASKNPKPIILSKTTTPLQRLQHKLKSEEKILREKRQNRRAKNLSAMRLPLAPTAGMSAEKLLKQKSTVEKGECGRNALAMASELEAERSYRRIATRGVVALFNAISKHRATAAAEAVAKEEEKCRVREEGGRLKKKTDGDSELGTTTKHGFLNLIKKSATVGACGGDDLCVDIGTGKDRKDDDAGNRKEKRGAVGWSALKDDFMMNSKLKVRLLL